MWQVYLGAKAFEAVLNGGGGATAKRDAAEQSRNGYVAAGLVSGIGAALTANFVSAATSFAALREAAEEDAEMREFAVEPDGYGIVLDESVDASGEVSLDLDARPPSEG